jgi:hypothetical protein
MRGIDNPTTHAMSQPNGIDGALVGVSIDVNNVGLGNIGPQHAFFVREMEETRGLLRNVGYG